MHGSGLPTPPCVACVQKRSCRTAIAIGVQRSSQRRIDRPEQTSPHAIDVMAQATMHLAPINAHPAVQPLTPESWTRTSPALQHPSYTIRQHAIGTQLCVAVRQRDPKSSCLSQSRRCSGAETPTTRLMARLAGSQPCEIQHQHHPHPENARHAQAPCCAI